LRRRSSEAPSKSSDPLNAFERSFARLNLRSDL
jgi:hypothetical protein